MAKIGLKNPVYAKYAEAGATATYSGGASLGEAMNASASIEINESNLYADDKLAESIKEFKSGKISVEITDLDDIAATAIFGHTQADAGVTAEVSGKMSVSGENDESAFVGIGFYGRKVKNHAITYRGYWYPKVQFSEPTEDFESKGENLNFKTVKMEGTIMRDAAGNWRKTFESPTEANVVTWLNTLASITK